MNWNNIDLKSSESSINILDPYSFDTLLLEISCNVKEISNETVKRQFFESLNSKIESAKEVFFANLDNITKEATEYRNID